MINKTLYIIAFLFASFQIFSQSKQTTLVSDDVGILSPQEKMVLESKLIRYSDSTSNQIAVVITNSISDEAPADYATRIGREWGVGQKDKNNGVVLLIIPTQRKVWIAPGYGLEGVLPDIICKRIIENEIKPYFRQNAYYQGIENGTNAMIKAIAGEYKANKKKGNPSKQIILGVFFLFFIIIMIINAVSKKNSVGNIGKDGYKGSSGMGAAFILGSLLGSMGGRNSSGSYGVGNSFGGFGGGSFGGGGAGGSW